MNFLETKRRHFLVSFFVGLAAAIVAGSTVGWRYAPLAGWDALALVFTLTIWLDMHGKSARLVASTARKDDMSRVIFDGLVLAGAVISLVAVVILLTSKQTNGFDFFAHVGFGFLSILISWFTIHTIYALRYAVLYYVGDEGGIDFSSRDKPNFTDFAYVAFTIGMTYQVSDTTMTSREMRRAAIGQAMVSFLYGIFILAAVVNFFINLSS